MKKIKNDRAITLVALVITIILLLILAGISIQAMTSTGLFEAAGRAKKEAKRAQVVEWLNLKLVEKQSENTKGTTENIIKAVQKSVKINISELETIGKDIVVEDTKTEEDGEKVDIYFYVQVDEDVYKIDIKGAKFIGEAGKLPPVVKIESITSTTNSITVKVSTKRNESGKLEFYIKAEDEEKYKDIENIKTEKNADNLEFTYTGLEQNKKYSIKIVAIAENKQTAEVTKENIQVGNVPELTQRDVEFSYSPSSWTNGSVMVKAKLKEDNVQGYTLKITDSNPVGASKTTALGWKNASEGVTVSANKTIYAVLIDNGGQIGGAATGNVDKIDTQKPVAKVSSTTTNSMTFTGTDTANTSENEKASGIAGYIVKDNNTVPDKDDSSWKSYNGASKTVSGLTQGKTYYVFVKDKAGNVSVASSKGTGNVTNLTTANVTFTYNPSSWTNGSVKVTAVLKDMTSNYTLKITDSNPVGASKTTALGWKNASEGVTVSANKTIYAVLIDNEGQIGKAATVVIDNIDKTGPSVPTIRYNGGSNTCNWKNSYNITLNSTDSQSGVDHYQIDYQGDGNVDTDNVSSNFIPNNGYDSCKVRFRAVDKVGNVSKWTEEQHIHMDTSVLKNNGTYYIHSSNSSKNVININGNYITEDAANAEIWGKKSVTDNGKFTIVNVTGEWYKIVCKASGKVLDVDAGVGENLRNVRQYTYNGTNAQLWKFISAEDGNYYIQSKLGYNLDVLNNDTDWGTNVDIYEPNGTAAQRWKLISTQ